MSTAASPSGRMREDFDGRMDEQGRRIEEQGRRIDEHTRILVQSAPAGE